MPEPDPNDDVLDNVVEIPSDPVSGDEQMPVNLEYWQERLYKSADNYDADSKFFENSQKSAHIEGKMGAREMTFSKGGGLPTVMPLPSNQGSPQNP